MKKTLLFILCFVALTLNAGNYRVLFIGNSYTDVNNLPQMVYKVLSSTGNEMIYLSSTPGGSTFYGHVQNSNTMAYIMQGGWDFVVLQAQSQEPSFPIEQFMAETYPYAEQLCNAIRIYSPNATILFYMTWGRENGDTQNGGIYPPIATYEGMDNLLRERYMMMAEDNNAQVSPVGPLWRYLRNKYPGLQLYQSDGSHPTLEGSYAAACSFYTLITHESPVAITENCGVNSTIARVIRESAEKVVFDSLYYWTFTQPSGGDDEVDVVNYERKSSFNVMPNPATDYITISGIEAKEGEVTFSVYDQMGRLLKVCGNGGMDRFDIDVSSLKPGIYFLQMQRDGVMVRTQKFIKAN